MWCVQEIAPNKPFPVGSYRTEGSASAAKRTVADWNARQIMKNDLKIINPKGENYPFTTWIIVWRELNSGWGEYSL